MTESRQLRSFHTRSLDRLKDGIPDACPIDVRYDPGRRCFTVVDIATGDDICASRYQVVAAFIDGYLRGWLTWPR